MMHKTKERELSHEGSRRESATVKVFTKSHRNGSVGLFVSQVCERDPSCRFSRPVVEPIYLAVCMYVCMYVCSMQQEGRSRKKKKLTDMQLYFRGYSRVICDIYEVISSAVPRLGPISRRALAACNIGIAVVPGTLGDTWGPLETVPRHKSVVLRCGRSIYIRLDSHPDTYYLRTKCLNRQSCRFYFLFFSFSLCRLGSEIFASPRDNERPRRGGFFLSFVLSFSCIDPYTIGPIDWM